MVHKLQKRMHNDHGWLVTAKALMTFHRLVRECDTSFQDEMLHATETVGRRRLLCMSNYRDVMSNDTWDVSTWIRVYSTFLDERLNVYKVLKYDFDGHADAQPVSERLAGTPSQELFEIARCLQRLVDAMYSCIPEGSAMQHAVCCASSNLAVKEFAKAYTAMHEATLLVAERVLETSSPGEATEGLELVRKGKDLYERAAGFKSRVDAAREVARGVRMPEITPPPSEAINVLEEHVASLTGRPAHGRAGAVKAKANPVMAKALSKGPAVSYAKVEVRASDISNFETDLLTDLKDLDFPEPVKPTIAAAPATDPFGIQTADMFADMSVGPEPVTSDPFGGSNHNSQTPSSDPFGGKDLFGSDPFSSPAPSNFSSDPFSSPAPAAATPSEFSAMSTAFNTPASSAFGSVPTTPTPPAAKTLMMDDLFGSSGAPTPEPATPQFAPMASPHSHGFSAPATPPPAANNNPFGSAFVSSSSYYSPTPPNNNPFGAGAGMHQTPAAANGSALAAAGLSPTMVASTMAKTSVHDPFAELTSSFKPAQPSPLGNNSKPMRA